MTIFRNIQNTLQKKLFPNLQKMRPLEIYLFLTIIAGFLFVMSLIQNEEKYTTIRVEVINRDWTVNNTIYGMRAPFWLSDKVEIGLVQRSVTGSPVAEIVAVENYERGNEEAEIYLTVKVKTKVNKKTLEKTFLTYPLQVGGEIQFDFPQVKVPGQIVDVSVPDAGYERKEFIVKGKIKSQEQWLVDALSKNEKMINRATGETIAELVDFSVEPAKSSVISDIDSNSIQLQTVPNLYDITVTMKMLAQQQDGRWYFGGHQRIRVGNTLWVYTENVDLREIEVQEIMPVNE